MNKLITASFILVVLVALQTSAFAASMTCKFKDVKMEKIETIQINEASLVINEELEIPLEESQVKCGNFGRQIRLDGSALGYQIILKSCTTDAKMEGHLIDSIEQVAADVLCDLAE